MNKLSETVQSIYAAFGRGDVPAILETLADDVHWEYAWAASEVPWLEPRRGRANVVGFFQALGTHLEFTNFTVNEILEGPDVVVALCNVEAKVKGTDRVLREIDEAHIWRFDERGRVSRFRHAADTLGHLRALRGA